MLHNYHEMNPLQRFHTMNQPHQQQVFQQNHFHTNTFMREEPLYDTRFDYNYKNPIDNYYLNKQDNFDNYWMNKPKNKLIY